MARIILFARGFTPAAKALCSVRPLCMTPLLDRPFVQHVVEYLVGHGVAQIEFVLCHLPRRIEEFLGDGRRWGASFVHNLAREAERPYGVLRGLCPDPDEWLILGHADRLPDLEDVDFLQAEPETPTMLMAADRDTGASHWTGWARLRAGALPGHLETLDEVALGTALASVCQPQATPPPLSVNTYEDVLSSQFRALTGQFKGLMLAARQPDENIWISRNVSLHPTARLTPPVFIGENCNIGMGAQLGPNAAIDANCILDNRCNVQNSLVLRDSYVGEGLELADVIVDRNQLLNVRFGTTTTVVDDFILSSLEDRRLRHGLAFLCGRVGAGLLAVALSPLLVAIGVGLKLRCGGPVLHRHRCIRLPADTAPGLWRECVYYDFHPGDDDCPAALAHWLTQWLPGLLSVALGRLHLVGVRPLPPEQVEALPEDWRALYLQAKAGILTEAYTLYGASPSDDELYGAEAFYAVQPSPQLDLRLLLAYLWSVLRNERRGDNAESAAD